MTSLRNYYTRSPGVATGREVLTADRTYFVRTDGNDSNNGLVNSASGAFLTIQKAADVVAALDVSIYAVTIQIGDGTYTAGVQLKMPVWGGGNLTLKGNTSTPGNVIIQPTTGVGCGFAQAGTWFVQDFEVRGNASNNCITSTSPAGIIRFQNIRFGTSTNGHLVTANGGRLIATGNYSIVGGAASHIWHQGPGFIEVFGRTITLTGTPAFGTAFLNSERGLGYSYLVNNTFTGSATGSSYRIQGNGVCVSNQTLPGNSGGTTSEGGRYFAP